MKKNLFLFGLLCSIHAFGQAPLKVYFSTVNFTNNFENIGFLKTESQEYAFVRDRKLCDVQVLEISESAALDARRIKQIFVGYGRFQGQNDTLFLFVNAAENPYSVREKRLQSIKEGLLPYLLQTEWGNSITFVNEMEMQPSKFEQWEGSLFNISGDGGFVGNDFDYFVEDNLLSEIKNKSFIYNIGLSGAKITTKRRLGGNINFKANESKSSVTTGSFISGTIPILTTTQMTNSLKNLNYRAFHAEGITAHISVGAELSGLKNNTDNAHRSFLTVGAEYSFFPYSDWFERHLVLRYGLGKKVLGPTNNNFYAADNFDHALSLFYQKKHKWGYFAADMYRNFAFVKDFWNAWEHGVSLYSDIEIGRGLFFITDINFTTSNRDYGLYNSAPVYSKAYRYYAQSLNIGLTYRLGTPWRTVVNPRANQIFELGNRIN